MLEILGNVFATFKCLKVAQLHNSYRECPKVQFEGCYIKIG